MRMLTDRRDYFDIRTGEIWDLFFPGYYRYGHMEGGVPVGDPLDNWGFSPPAFDKLRRHVERRSEGRWRYSGGDDLIVICAWLPAAGDPTVDWSSTAGGNLAAADLPQVIERVTRDLEEGLEDANFGVGDVVSRSTGKPGGGTRGDLAVSVITDILTAIGLKLAGL